MLCKLCGGLQMIVQMKDTKDVTEKPKKSRYQKFVDIVNDYTDDEELRELLVEHIKLCLEISKERGKPLYANQYKGILRALDRESNNDIDTKFRLVERSLERGWISFYANSLDDNKQYNDMVRRGIQMPPSDAKAFKSREEKEEYEENLKKEYERSGRRAVF